VKHIWRKLRYKWELLLDPGGMLNRRVDVENTLFNVAAGKRPPLTNEECRALAIKLGTPQPKAKK
jgi:hypothetical protein